MERISTRLTNFILIFAFFLILSLINFGGNLRSGFMMDDHDLIVNHAFVQSPQLSNLYQHFIPDFKARMNIESAPHAVYYRPIAHIVPFLQYLAFGKDPFGYHLSNLVLFAFACLCLYWLIFRVAGDRPLAFLAATLFCLHPINGLMVNYMTASVYAIQLILLSLCVIFYLRKEQNVLYACAAYLMFILSLLCHETSLMLPMYLLLISWHQRMDWKKILQRIAPFFLIAFIYFVARLYFANINTSVVSKFGLHPDLNLVSYAATFSQILLWYFEKFFTLQGIVLMWSTPLTGNLLWVVGLIILSGVFVLLLSKYKGESKRISILWFLLGVLPITMACMISPATGMVMEPHWLFFASVGLFVLIAGILLQVSEKMSPRVRSVGFAAICVIFMGASWNNNALWKDELTYTQYWVKETPTDKSLGFYVGAAYFNQQNLPEAKKWFLRSLTNGWMDWQNYNNLADIALKENDEAAALDYFQKALAVFPQSAVVYNNIGTYHLGKKEWSTAEQYFLKSATLNPYQPEPLLNLGLIYEQANNWDKAWASYLSAYDLRPKDERIMGALLRMALKGYGHDEILTRSEEFLKEIRSESLLIEMGGQFAINGRNVVATKYFLKAVELYPHKITAYREAGKVLANAGHFAQAKDLWTAGLAVKPDDQELKDLLKELEILKAQTKL